MKIPQNTQNQVYFFREENDKRLHMDSDSCWYLYVTWNQNRKYLQNTEGCLFVCLFVCCISSLLRIFFNPMEKYPLPVKSYNFHVFTAEQGCLFSMLHLT